MGANIDRDGQYAARAGNFVNNWNPNVSVPERPDIKGMMQVTIISSPVLYPRAETLSIATVPQRYLQLHRPAPLQRSRPSTINVFFERDKQGRIL